MFGEKNIYILEVRMGQVEEKREQENVLEQQQTTEKIKRCLLKDKEGFRRAGEDSG